METHSRYYDEGFSKWINDLSPEKRSIFEHLRIASMKLVDARIAFDLIQPFNIRSVFSQMKYSSTDQFIKAEIFNAVENLIKVWRPSCNLFDIQYELLKLQEHLEEDASYSYFESSNNESYLFASLIWSLRNEYLNTNIKQRPDGKLDLGELKDFDQIVEFIIWFKWIENLIGFLQERKSNLSFELKLEQRRLGDIALQLVWEGTIVNRGNRDNIAMSFPELGLKNGNKLHQKVNYYSYKPNRVGDSEEDSKNRLHLKYMNRALKYLTEKECIESAQKEILTFIENVNKNRGQKL